MLFLRQRVFRCFRFALPQLIIMAGLRSLAPLLRASAPAVRNPAIAYRFLSSSTRSSATPTPLPNANQPVSLGQHTTQHHPSLPTNIIVGGNKTAHWNEATFPNLPPTNYNQGPSALDKASRLFFFTEILRGEPPFFESQFSDKLLVQIINSSLFSPAASHFDGMGLGTNADHSLVVLRNGGRLGTILQTSLYDHVPLWSVYAALHLVTIP